MNSALLLKLGTLIIISAIAAIGQLLIKKGLTEVGSFGPAGILSQIIPIVTNAYILIALMLYAVGLLLYFSLLSRMQLGVLYPAGIGLNFTVVTIASYIFLGEPFPMIKIIGLVLIASGITCLILSNGIR